jgi:hypothetical protein
MTRHHAKPGFPALLRGAVLAVCLLGAISGESRAQYLPEYKLMAYGTAAAPMNPSLFRDFTDAGYGGGIAVGIVPKPVATVIINFSSLRFQSDLPGTGNMHHRFFSLETRLFFIPEPRYRVRPYVNLGFGLAWTTFSDSRFVQTQTENSLGLGFGVIGGGGVEVRILDTSTVFVEMDYMVTLQDFAVQTPFETLTGGEFGFTPVRIGFAIGLGVYR